VKVDKKSGRERGGRRGVAGPADVPELREWLEFDIDGTIYRYQVSKRFTVRLVSRKTARDRQGER
jgi:hypothetical protein